jgi:hydrophobe/amphiphile efflux-1 (HAE1) family protein
MRLNISAWAIRQPIPSLVLFLVLMVLGIVSFRHLPVMRFPNIDIPIITVMITQPGAAPGELETQVTKKAEDAVSSIPGVKHTIGLISDGQSLLTIQFDLGINSDRAVNDVKDAIARIRADLPRSIDEPIIQRLDVAGLPIATYAAYAPSKTPEQLSWFIDDTVARQVQGVKGVGKVERLGGVDREIRIALNPDTLQALGVTAADVNRQIRITNTDLSGGRAEIGGQEQAIRTLAGARQVQELAATAITLPGGRKVRLDTLGRIFDFYAEPRTYARLDGQPVVAFSISRATGASDADVGMAVERKMVEIRERHPDITLSLIDTSVTYTIGNYKSAMHTLIEGAVLAVLVVLIFLKDWRATLVAAIALPLSIIPTFWAMSALGFSLNLVSLLGITLVTGILVDDAIVEIENIVRHMRMGKSAYRAALEAADEIGLAVIAISFTIIAVFVPVSFMGGIAGQYFKQFGLTVAMAVLFSLLVARLITPLLAAYFMRAQEDHTEQEGRVLKAYIRLVEWSVHHRWKTVAAGVLVFALSLASTKLLPSDFLPQEDISRLVAGIEMPPGTRLEDNIILTDTITRRLKILPEVKSVFTDGGRILGGSAEIRKASLVINLIDKSERSKTQKQIEAEIGAMLEDIPDIRFWFIAENGQRELSLQVLGNDGAAVAAAAAAITSQMRTLPMLANVVSTAPLDRPEIRVTPLDEKAAELGVSTDAISEALRVATIGDVTVNLAKFNAGDRLVPIRVQLETDARGQLGILDQLKVQGARGPVPLSAVAKVSLGQGPASIQRYDRARRIALEADLKSGVALGDAVNAVNALPAARAMPAGMALKVAGDAEVMGEVFESFALAMGAGLMMVYGVLVLLFGSFLLPVTILFSLPLSLGGVILALVITQKAISMPVVIGILMLMGVVTKNAIMLVDFAVEEIARGVSRTEAIIDAGRKRARPIVMTTIAMVAGMVPSALAFGAGGEFRAPMAIAVIGGLIVSTALSLVFVPAVFTVMEDVSFFLWSLFSRFLGERDEPEETSPATHHEEPRFLKAAE